MTANHSVDTVTNPCSNCRGVGSVVVMCYSRVCPVCHGIGAVQVPRRTAQKFPAADVVQLLDVRAKRLRKES